MVSVPYGVMPYGRPASTSRCQTADRVPGVDVDLVGELAGEADPGQPDRHPVQGGVPPGHERERLLGDVDVGEDGADDVAGARADDGEGGPLLGDRGAVHPQLRPLGLQPLLHPVEDLRRAAGGGEDEEAVLGQAQHRAVVDHHAVDPAHDAVADRADLQAAHQVRVEPVEQDARRRGPGRRSCRAWSRRGCRRRCAPRRTRAAPRPPCPRRAAGSSAGASTGRRPRRRPRRRRASRAGR